MSRLDVASLHKGDVIETTRTHQVTYVSGAYVETEDVQNGRRFGFAQRDVDESTLKLQMVKRAVRKPKVGDVITGDDLVDHVWKPGTTVEAQSGDVYVRRFDGEWACSAGGTFSSASMHGTWTATLLHVA